MCIQLEAHASHNSLHDPYQSAYRKGFSTETALLKVQNDLLEALDGGSCVALLMLDLSTVFDTLDHSIMFQRLEQHHGITSTALQWFKSYFSARNQRVTVAEASSGDVNLQYGVLQGSVLGLKAYTMYTAPLGVILQKNNMQYMMYADDTQGYAVIKPQQNWRVTSSALENCVSEISDWMACNQLKLNHAKTEYIIFSPRQHRPLNPDDYAIQVGTSSLMPAKSVRNLGVIQDSNLTMENQVSSITKTCYYHIRRIGKMRSNITSDACKTLVQATITSRLDYANALLYGIPSKLTDRLQMVQNSAARLVTRTRRRDHITPVLVALHWLPVKYRIRYKVLLYTFKALHETAPPYICSLVTRHAPSRTLRSSSSDLVRMPKSKSKTYGDRAFRVAAATLWNALPNELRSTASMMCFKKKLKTHLFRLAYN